MSDPLWLRDGQGNPPTLRWSFMTEAPLVAIDLGRESGEVLIADEAGGLYRISRRGELLKSSQSLRNVRAVVLSDTNSFGAALVGDRKVFRFNSQLEPLWSVDLPDAVLAIAVAPYGRQTAVSLANSKNLVLGEQSEQLSIFETPRPLRWIQCLPNKPVLIGAAEFGHVCAHRISGEQVWSARGFASLGEMCAAADGKTILVAAFNQGIQSYDSKGESSDSYLMEGTVCRVSCSHNTDRIAAATLERQLCWMNSDGRLLWATDVGEEIVRTLCDPLGKWLIVGLRSGQILRLDWDR